MMFLDILGVSEETYEVVESHSWDFGSKFDFKIGDKVKLVKIYPDKPFGHCLDVAPDYVAVVNIDNITKSKVRGFPSQKLKLVYSVTKLGLLFEDI